MRARLVLREKRVVWSSSTGKVGIAEIKVWQVPHSAHYPEARKFSLFFTVDGNVLVGIDNHKPKGPHLHYRGGERSLTVTDEGKLLAMFWDLVRQEGFEP
jgi:hypothetical protein